MLSTGAFLQVLVPLYIIAAIGFASRKMSILNSNANQVITQLMLYITLPALILYSLNTTFSTELLTDSAWLVAMSIFILCISVILASWLRRKAMLPEKQKTVYESLIIFGNQGFIGFAIIYLLMAEQGIIYLTIFNICYLILIWTYGIYIFTKREQGVNWIALFFNPGILSTLVGLVMLFLPYTWPRPFLVTFESVGKMTIPLSMLLIGSLLADIGWQEFRRYSKNLYVWNAAMFKLLIFPLFLFVFLFLHVPYPLLIVAVLTSAMPSASTTSVYAQKFGGDASFASFGVMMTTLLCMLTIPLLYSLLQWLHPFFYS
ncbi:AEC family transporter [Sporosarcina sp. G11-34]|uniref:AEC family transporter n=1 Tax=Sporosarcina sp. G11-34 TaxID=2849605 RepID=UPI0022A8EA46|nr:AEC family transporter [Sporosarcina sp. G11-34]MCZ2259868.1 AEC family transporter [Sporosarcina sp. G11-34]